MPGYTYRIHPAGEAPETCVGSARADGWRAEGDVPIEGVAACDSLAALARYIRTYGLRVEPGDLLIELEGPVIGPDHDPGAIRVDVTAVGVVGDAGPFAKAACVDLDDALRWGAEYAEVRCDIIAAEGLGPEATVWLDERVADEWDC